MSVAPSEIEDLLIAGKAAAQAGDTFAARSSFRRVTELDPSNVDGWVGLSGVVPVLAEKREYLTKALALAPGDAEIEASLAYVQGLITEGHQIAPSQRRQLQNETRNSSPLLGAPEPATAPETQVFCYNHPDRETGLRCNQCNRPICGQCARPAAVGQLCPECAKARRPVNYQVSGGNIAVAAIIALLAGAIATRLIFFVLAGFFAYLVIFLGGPFVGELTARVIGWATKQKRGRAMQIAAGVGFGLGALGWVLLTFNLFAAIFAAVVIVTLVARLK